MVSPNSETVQVLKLSTDGIETIRTYAFGETVQSAVFPDLSMATAEIFTD